MKTKMPTAFLDCRFDKKKVEEIPRVIKLLIMQLHAADDKVLLWPIFHHYIYPFENWGYCTQFINYLFIGTLSPLITSLHSLLWIVTMRQCFIFCQVTPPLKFCGKTDPLS